MSNVIEFKICVKTGCENEYKSRDDWKTLLPPASLCDDCLEEDLFGDGED